MNTISINYCNRRYPKPEQVEEYERKYGFKKGSRCTDISRADMEEFLSKASEYLYALSETELLMVKEWIRNSPDIDIIFYSYHPQDFEARRNNASQSLTKATFIEDNKLHVSLPLLDEWYLKCGDLQRVTMKTFSADSLTDGWHSIVAACIAGELRRFYVDKAEKKALE